MRHLSIAAIAVVSTVAFGQIATAADLPIKAPVAPVPAPHNWTGFYFGLNAGYGWGGSTGNGITLVDPTNQLNLYAAAGGFRFPNVSPNGAIGGGQIGYNYQTGNWVWGLVADFQFSDMTKTGQVIPFLPPFAPLVQSHSASIDWFGTARGRVGWAFNRFLPYISGGLAYGKVSSTLNFSNPVIVFLVSGASDTTRAGWTVGAGFEYAVNNNVSLGVDYLYMDLGHDTVSATNQTFFNLPVVISMDQHFTANIVRAVINFKF